MQKLGTLLALLALSGCGKDEKSGAAAGSASASAASAAPRAAAPVSAATSASLAPATTPACRALRVSGDARLGSAALTSGSIVDGSEWVDLTDSGKLTLKHTATGRELSIAGPARFRA